MVESGDVSDLIADRPDLEDALRALLDVDESTGEWTFDDVPVETGEFGELVASDVVKGAGDGYRLADPDAVRAALADANESDANKSDANEPDVATNGAPASTDRESGVDLSLPAVEGVPVRSVSAALVLAVVVAFPRSLTVGKVFRETGVVLSGNDPYFYRYWVDQALAQSSSPVGLDALFGAPIADGTGEPLLVATLWWLSTLLGGTREVAGALLAVYPVVAALAAAALVYAIGARVVGDRRVGGLAVLFFALAPGHAMRTALGFADHHAFDYVWLLAVISGLAWLATDSEWPLSRRTRRGALAFGVAIAGLALSWNGSPLVLLPVAGYFAIVVPLDVSDGRDLIPANGPVVAGLGVGAFLALGAHVVFGWQQLTVALAPALLTIGALALVGGGELLRRRGVGARQVVALEATVSVLGFVALALLGDAVLGQFLAGIGRVFGTVGVGEASSAFSPETLLGVEQFGGVVVLALPFLFWAGKRALLGDREWLVLSLFAWYLLVLSLFQLRFVGQLTPLIALFAGLTVVWAFARVDLTSPPAPLQGGEADDTPVASGDGPVPWVDASVLSVRSGVVALVLLVALVGPGLAFLTEQVSSTTVSDSDYRTAAWMADYADEQDWTYPDDYVLSDWGMNRAYNYPVNGVADNYSFARANFSRFVSTADPDPLYHEWHDRVGFIVLEPLPPRDDTAQQHLYNTYGSRWVTTDGETRYAAVLHYRAVYTTPNGDNKVFTLVPGAGLTGTAPPNSTVSLRTWVDIPNDQFTYRTVATANATGQYRVTVPHPGEYTIEIGKQTRTVTVPESAVTGGENVTVP